MSYANKKTFDNTNKGALFKNEEMKSDKSPQYTGKINVGGKDFYLSGWVRESKTGNKFFSLSVTDPSSVQRPGNTGGGYQQKQAAPVRNEMNDEIPF